MSLSWIAAYPDWYISERRLLAEHYPDFWVDEPQLATGSLTLLGELTVRPPGGAQRHPVKLEYPAATPFEKPVVVPLEALPDRDEHGGLRTSPTPKMYDHRHQMPGGALCLFQRETRADPAGDIISGVEALRRAEKWFLGTHTGRWPPDSAESELQTHFHYASDILLGSALFEDSRLNGGSGHFFFTYDYRRTIDVPSDNPPMIVTSATIESGPVVQVADMRQELARVYPWIRNEAWSTTSAINSDIHSSTGFDPVDQGYWWSLPSEPQPFAKGAGLLSAIAEAFPETNSWNMVRAALGTELTTSPKHFIGLRYLGRDGGVEWLVLLILPGQRKEGGGFIFESDLEQRRRFEAAPVVGIRVHTIRPAELWLRNTGVVSDKIASKRVALIGLGALGSRVAELLAQAGVGGFRLCDSDSLAVGNVARHVGGIPEFGAAKTRVVASRLLEINPHVMLEVEDMGRWSATHSPEQLASFMKTADLVITTTADESVESYINDIALRLGKPVLYGRALRRASLGRVFLVRPDRDACKACLATYAVASREGKPVPTEWIDVQESADDVLLHECGRPIIPGSGIDLSFIATLIARVALSVLEGNDDEANHWLWAREEAAEIDARLLPLSTHVGRIEPRPDCPVCSVPPIRGVLLPNAIREQIVKQIESSLVAETGGILIGYLDEKGCAVVTRATESGPAAKQSADRFHRDVAFVQAELDRANAELGEHGGYLGEWHSHLVPDPRPSVVDIDSLFGIAKAPHYLNRNPVLMIAGLDQKTGRCATIKTWVFQFGGGMHSVDVLTDTEDSS